MYFENGYTRRTIMRENIVAQGETPLRK